MSAISDHIREAACADAPAEQLPNIAMWIGREWQWDALDFIECADGRFFRADEPQQRLFLLLVAEALA